MYRRKPARGFLVLLCASLLTTGLGLSSSSAAVRRPDLTIKALVATEEPSSRQMTIREVVVNRGRAEADASRTAFFVSSDFGLDASDTRLPIAHRVAKLRPRKKAAKTLLTTAPASPVPPYLVIACADYANKVKESNESNNCEIAAVFRGAAEQLVDIDHLFSTSRGLPEGWGPLLTPPVGDEVLRAIWPAMYQSFSKPWDAGTQRHLASRRVAARHGPPPDEQSTETFDSGTIQGDKSTGQATGAVRGKTTGDRLSIDSDLTSKLSGTGSNGSVTAEWTQTKIESRAFEVGYCPNASGVVSGTWSHRSKKTTDISLNNGERGHHVVEVSFEGTVTAQTNDAGTLSSFDVAGTVTQTVRSEITSAGGEVTSYTDSVSATLSFDNVAPTRTDGYPSSSSVSMSDADITVDASVHPDLKGELSRLAAGGGALAVDTVVRPGLAKAEGLWTGGYCVEVELDVAGDTQLKAGESVEITASVWHRHEQTEVQVPVKGTLGGPYLSDAYPDEKLVPENEFRKAPFTFTYTAPEKGTQGWEGFKRSGSEVSFETASPRGKASASVRLTAAGPETVTGQITVTWTHDYVDAGRFTGHEEATAQVTLKLAPDEFDGFSDAGSSFTYNQTLHYEGQNAACYDEQDHIFEGSGDFDGNGPGGWVETNTFYLGLLSFPGVTQTVNGYCAGSYGYTQEDVPAYARFCPDPAWGMFGGPYQFEYLSEDSTGTTYVLDCTDTDTYDNEPRSGTITVEASGTITVSKS